MGKTKIKPINIFQRKNIFRKGYNDAIWAITNLMDITHLRVEAVQTVQYNERPLSLQHSGTTSQSDF